LHAVLLLGYGNIADWMAFMPQNGRLHGDQLRRHLSADDI